MPDVSSPEYERIRVKFINGKLDRVMALLSKAMVELEHGNLNAANETLLAVRRTNEALAKKIAKLEREKQQALKSRLEEVYQAITRSERRLDEETIKYI